MVSRRIARLSRRAANQIMAPTTAIPTSASRYTCNPPTVRLPALASPGVQLSGHVFDFAMHDC